MNPITKTCTKCGIDKPLEEFYKKKRGRYGKSAACKDCEKTYSKHYLEENKEKNRARKKKYNRINKEKLRAKSKEYYEKNREKILTKRNEGREEYNAKHREYRKKRKLRAERLEEIDLMMDKYFEEKNKIKKTASERIKEYYAKIRKRKINSKRSRIYYRWNKEKIKHRRIERRFFEKNKVAIKRAAVIRLFKLTELKKISLEEAEFIMNDLGKNINQIFNHKLKGTHHETDKGRISKAFYYRIERAS